MKLEGKVAVVTGSSTGIGLAIAKRYLQEGANTVLTYHTNRCLQSDSDGLYPMKWDYLYLDVTDRTSIRSLFQQVFDKYGGIDILVNNAGINRPADFNLQTDREWDAVTDVCLKGAWRCCQEIDPFIRPNGAIINIGSLSARNAGPRTPSYNAAKAAVEYGLTKCAAKYYAPRKIRVNCISPGVVANEFTEKTMAPWIKTFNQERCLLKRWGTVEDIAGPAVFLASDDSSYITGHVLHVDGGFL
ncbi:MAG: SDR family oxidoreductase [Deltaproteobacteria bacterium]|nr:SDR family oxidoreductase [Deltaproteobacteria bacterium]